MMVDTGKLAGKIALITGGTSGIGLASARLFRGEGATVIVTGTNPEKLAAAASDGFDAIACDQSKMADLDTLFDTITERHGRIDVLFGNAGAPGALHKLGSVTEEVYDTIMGLNLKGLYFTVQKALTLMPDGGAIVLTASVAAHSGLPGSTIYAASKAGVRSLGRGFAAELLKRKIRVNTLTPGLTDTPAIAALDALPGNIRDHLVSLVPMRRSGTSEEAAAAALFLASNDSSFMTGAEIIVSGGQIDL